MTYRPVPRLVDHLWYPIVVRSSSGAGKIVELQGKKVNEWNDMVRKQWHDDTKNHPRGWCV